MIACIHPDVRIVLSDDELADVVHTVDAGVRCRICEMPLRPEVEEKANVIGLREQCSGRLAIRYAHHDCAPSALIDVARICDETAPSPPVSTPRRVDLAWALSARVPLLPTVVLTWDVETTSGLAVGGRILLDALRVEGLRGGTRLARIEPTRFAGITASRDGTALILSTPYGRESLALEDLAGIQPLLHVAAHQRELLLIAGERLSLGEADLEEAERRLELDEALAARIGYSDPELAKTPLRSRRVRIARRLLSISPSARARRRALRTVRAQALEDPGALAFRPEEWSR